MPVNATIGAEDRAGAAAAAARAVRDGLPLREGQGRHRRRRRPARRRARRGRAATSASASTPTAPGGRPRRRSRTCARWRRSGSSCARSRCTASRRCAPCRRSRRCRSRWTRPHAPGAGATRAVCLKITRGGITGVLADARAARARRARRLPGLDLRRPARDRRRRPRRRGAADHALLRARDLRPGERTGAPSPTADRSPCLRVPALWLAGSVRAMAREWPETPDDPVDPALAPLIEAGEGESEGFELAEADLIEHAEHGDQHSTDPIMRDAPGSTTPRRRLRRRRLRGGRRRGRPGLVDRLARPASGSLELGGVARRRASTTSCAFGSRSRIALGDRAELLVALAGDQRHRDRRARRAGPRAAPSRRCRGRAARRRGRAACCAAGPRRRRPRRAPAGRRTAAARPIRVANASIADRLDAVGERVVGCCGARALAARLRGPGSRRPAPAASTLAASVSAAWSAIRPPML